MIVSSVQKSFWHLNNIYNFFKRLKKLPENYRFYTMSQNNFHLVAVCQLNCTSDREKNFEKCKSFIKIASSRQTKMIFFPECFDHVGESKEQSVQLGESLDGVLLSKYKQLAQEHSIWLSLGGFHEKGSEKNENRVSNSHIIINDKGEILSVYRKVHMFDIDVPGSVKLRESDYTIPGKEVVSPVDTPVGKIGLGICYDLRFPEFSLSLTKAGAEILTYPSAFTQTTGMAHWEILNAVHLDWSFPNAKSGFYEERDITNYAFFQLINQTLLRTRAIECQSYVIAAAQTGRHNPKRTSYGHAMIVDPWGCVIACCSEGEGIAFADINIDYVKKIRSQMPVSAHRRSELYGCIIPAESSQSEPVYLFGSIQLLPRHIFHKTRYSMAFVNKKCVVPGHVLVTPLRCAKRFCDLLPHEVADLFLCVQNVQKVIESEYAATSSTVCIQDGPEAGQTVPHVHVHILPRKIGDFKKNDEIYEQLQTHDKSDDIKWRTDEEMTEECLRLRKYFQDSVQ